MDVFVLKFLELEEYLTLSVQRFPLPSVITTFSWNFVVFNLPNQLKNLPLAQLKNYAVFCSAIKIREFIQMYVYTRIYTIVATLCYILIEIKSFLDILPTEMLKKYHYQYNRKVSQKMMLINNVNLNFTKSSMGINMLKMFHLINSWHPP